jgi:HSP20 family protein
MFNVEEQTTRLEQLYRQITGWDPRRRSDQPIAPIPPEVNAERYVQDNLQRLNAVLEIAGLPSTGVKPPLPTATPRVSLFEDKDDYFIVAELPGVKESDLSAQITQGILRITATRSWPGVESPPQRVLYAEAGPCRFERLIPLPPFMKFDSGEGRLKKGILTLKLPKDQSAIRKDFNIEVA